MNTGFRAITKVFDNIFTSFMSVGQDAQVTVIYPGKHTSEIKLSGLPLLSLVWVSESRIVAAGFDCTPVLLEAKDGLNWSVNAINNNRQR